MRFNQGYAYREQITQGGMSVLAYLVDRYRHSPSEVWAMRIAAGEVELDGDRADPEGCLKAGQELVWNRPAWEEGTPDMAFTMVYEDEVMVAVAKPRGLPTLPGGGFLDQTLLAAVRARYPEASPMHRLGRETSGLVLFARTHGAASILQAAWRQRAVHKRYRALGEGIATENDYRITAPIGPVPHPLLGTLFAASEVGKASLSLAQVLERRETSTLFAVDIETGRPHQIRIHLAFAGHPLVGDPLYGPGGLPLRAMTALPGDGGYFLHAERLRFQHPLTKRELELWAEPPVELRCGI